MKTLINAGLYILAALLILGAAAANAATVQDKFFNSNGVQIRYVEEGTGEPIVLVHGYTNSIDEWMSSGVFQNLAKNFHVIALDNRGHGKSGKPHDPKAYGAEMSEDVVRLLDHLNIRRAHIVGYSMGGTIVAKVLTMHPDRFLTATLGGSGGSNVSNEPSARSVEMEASETERGSFRALILRVAPTDRRPPSDETIRERSQEIIDRGNDPRALAAYVRSKRNLEISDAQMAAVRVPTLAVVGSLDPNLKNVTHLKTVMPSLKVVVVEGAPHTGATPPVGTMWRPEFVSAIREFIAAQQGH